MKKLLEFNFLPIRYIHSSWLNTLPHADLLVKMRNNKKLEYSLSQYILDQSKLSNKYIFDIPKDIETIAFMDAPDLSKLVIYLGVCLNVNNLTSLIEKNSIHNVKSVIGEEAFLFGIKRAPYLLGIKSVIRKPEISPQLGEYIIACGSYYFLSILSQHAPEISKRIIWKLPSQWIENLAKQASSSHITEASLPITEIFSEINNYE